MTTDPYAGEPTQEIPENLWDEYQKAKDYANRWEQRAEELEAAILASNPDAHAFAVNGLKVIYNRPQEKWRLGDLARAYPDLIQHFMVPHTKPVFDTAAFGRAHPDILAQYQSRSFRRAG